MVALQSFKTVSSWRPNTPQGVVIDANTATREVYERQFNVSTPDLSEIETSIYAWTSPDIESEWLKEPNGADMSLADVHPPSELVVSR